MTSQPLISDQGEFDKLCEHIRSSGIVAFDTEFVSEHTYRPELCLLQLATSEQCVAVDPYQVRDLSGWWQIMADDETDVVVHAGREETRFCLAYANAAPRRLIDTQIAEGLQSRSYPLSHERLIDRVLGRRLQGNETRTDWRRRPLSKRQIDYALDDVRFLLETWERQLASLTRQGREKWAEAEFQRVVDEAVIEQSRSNWHRLSGIHKLRSRELAVARELFEWRENEALRRDEPVRRILRDDLLLDLARRKPRSVDDVLATRDMTRPNYKRFAGEIVSAVNIAMEIPDADLPKSPPGRRQDSNQDEHVLGQLLGIALANRCAELEVSKSLVGTSADLRDLVRWYAEGETDGQPPRLIQGWRAEVCGELLRDLLEGRIALRVANPESSHPLVFERLQED